MQKLKVDLTVYLTETQEFDSVISDTSELLGHNHMNAFSLTKRLEAEAGGRKAAAGKVRGRSFQA